VEESASKKEIIEMRTCLKHAENGAKSGKPECPNQSQNILSRLSGFPQKGDRGVLLTIVKATSSKVVES